MTACTSSDKKEGKAKSADQPAGKAVADAQAASGKVGPVVASTPAGKPTRVTEVGTGDKPFEITIPDGFKTEIQGKDEDEMLPFLVVTGPDFEVRIESPEAGFVELDQAKRMSTGGGINKVERAEAQPDGYVFVHSTPDNRYHVEVARPALDVRCLALDLDSRAEADAASALCQTLRP